MEDRVTDGLWLELSDLSTAAYGEARVDEVLSLQGVSLATWWDNLMPNRTDLPRTLDVFRTLGAYEVDTAFEAPTPPPGTLGLHYRRTGRPGQGSVSAEPTTGLSLVLIGARESGQEQALRDWADFVHIRHIAEAAVPGYSMITPYELVAASDGGDEPRFLHLYEMHSADPEATFQSMTPLVAERLGGFDTEAFTHWAMCPELRIHYVNSFALSGRR